MQKSGLRADDVGGRLLKEDTTEVRVQSEAQDCDVIPLLMSPDSHCGELESEHDAALMEFRSSSLIEQAASSFSLSYYKIYNVPVM